MSITIFHHESGSTEESLVVNDDGTVTHEIENSGWKMKKRGLNTKTKTMSAKEAKTSWVAYAKDIDGALEKIRKEHDAREP